MIVLFVFRLIQRAKRQDGADQRYLICLQSYSIGRLSFYFYADLCSMNRPINGCFCLIIPLVDEILLSSTPLCALQCPPHACTVAAPAMFFLGRGASLKSGGRAPPPCSAANVHANDK